MVHIKFLSWCSTFLFLGLLSPYAMEPDSGSRSESHSGDHSTSCSQDADWLRKFDSDDIFEIDPDHYFELINEHYAKDIASYNFEFLAHDDFFTQLSWSKIRSEPPHTPIQFYSLVFHNRLFCYLMKISLSKEQGAQNNEGCLFYYENYLFYYYKPYFTDIYPKLLSPKEFSEMKIECKSEKCSFLIDFINTTYAAMDDEVKDYTSYVNLLLSFEQSIHTCSNSLEEGENLQGKKENCIIS
jgi:hypothetical protein